MCGFVGYIHTSRDQRADPEPLARMAATLIHRGPDSAGYFTSNHLGLGFRRLSIIDLESGDQPIFNEDGSIVLLCNGEIFNYLELRRQLESKGHRFSTNSDVEVLLHLYEEEEFTFLNKLNGQFAFVLYDREKNLLFLARDQFGINPLYYTFVDELFIFASEVKAILEHPLAKREVDLTGLDQVFSFPGLVSPRTMFKNIASLKSGHYITVKNEHIRVHEYWDLNYPKEGELAYGRSEGDYIEELGDLLRQSVSSRLQADVPVGFYLSGGLDSSLIAALINEVSPGQKRHSFSIGFTQKEISETQYQRMMSGYIESSHHEIIFGWPEILERLASMIYHSECPVKETYNTCSMALSEAARQAGIKVILTGEGADELFAGYVGYRFDQFGIRDKKKFDFETILEEQLREKLWGNPDLFYEIDQYAFKEVKLSLYSRLINDRFSEVNCLEHELVRQEKLKERHIVHQRSYLDFKLRLSDHLISDHGDRMSLANSVEARYPFLDLQLIEFATRVPPNLKLNQFTEKYILRKVAEGLVPPEIVNREKYGFHAPGSPFLLRQNSAWVNDLLSYERIRRQGYFNPDTIERLKKQYSRPDFRLNLPFENDLLLIVLTFNLFKDIFRLPDLN